MIEKMRKDWTAEEWRDYLLTRPEHEAKEIIAHPTKGGSERIGAMMAQQIRDDLRHRQTLWWTRTAAIAAILGLLVALLQLLP
jgi:hypothetical protein